MPFIPLYEPFRLVKAKYPDWATGIPRTIAGKDAYEIAAKYENRFSRAFIEGMKDLFTPNLEKDFIDSWDSGSPDTVLGTFDFLNDTNLEDNPSWSRFLTRMRASYKVVIRATATDTIAQTNKQLGTNLRLDILKASSIPVVPVNPAAVDWMQTQSLNLITQGLLPNQETIVRELLVDRISQGRRPEKVYKEIRESIGLTIRENRAVENRRALLDEGGFSEEQIERGATKYRKQLLGKRAKRIARTETIAAQAEARRSTWRGAVNSGALQEANVEKVFLVAPGGCPICDELVNATTTIDGGYTTSDGYTDGPPVHPN